MRRLKTVRRPPIYPNGAQAISPVAPSPLFRCPHAVHRCPSVDSGLDFKKTNRVDAMTEADLADVLLALPDTPSSRLLGNLDSLVKSLCRPN